MAYNATIKCFPYAPRMQWTLFRITKTRGSSVILYRKFYCRAKPSCLVLANTWLKLLRHCYWKPYLSSSPILNRNERLWQLLWPFTSLPGNLNNLTHFVSVIDTSKLYGIRKLFLLEYLVPFLIWKISGYIEVWYIEVSKWLWNYSWHNYLFEEIQIWFVTRILVHIFV